MEFGPTLEIRSMRIFGHACIINIMSTQGWKWPSRSSLSSGRCETGIETLYQYVHLDLALAMNSLVIPYN